MEWRQSRRIARYCVGDVGGERRRGTRSDHEFNEGDLEGALKLFDPDAVYYEQSGNPLDTGDVLRRLDQIRDSVSSYIGQFPDFRSEIDELVEAGDKVVCVQRWTGTGRGSGIPTQFAGRSSSTRSGTARSPRRGSIRIGRAHSKPPGCRSRRCRRRTR